VNKPKHHRALCLAAFHCTHPDIDATDKALLVYLALHSNLAGENAHPGNINLSDALSLTDRPTDARLKKNIERGLIERTFRADGRGKASVYRLRLDSPCYPDCTPGGEELTEKPRCLDDAVSPDKPRCSDDAVSPETALSESVNRAVETPKPRCEGAETALSRQPANKYLTKTQHTHNTAKKSACVNSFSQAAKYLQTDMLTSQWKHGEKEAIEKIISEHGGEMFLAVELLYWREQDPDQFAKTLFKWTALINGFDGLVHKVTPEFLEELASTRWKAEHPEEWQRRHDASIARQTAEIVKRRNAEPQRNEVSPEDFFGERT
jgi:hypothetical protein